MRAVGASRDKVEFDVWHPPSGLIWHADVESRRCGLQTDMSGEAINELRVLLQRHQAVKEALRNAVLGPFDAEALRNELGIEFVQCRVKGFERAVRKLDEDTLPSDIHDLTGMRIVTMFDEQVDEVAEQLRGRFRSIESVDKRRPVEITAFTYRSLHLRCQLQTDEAAMLGVARCAGLRFEVQVRSLLQHTWAAVDHDFQYRDRDSTPTTLQWPIARLSGLLEIGDLLLNQLRNEVRDHRRRVAEDIGASGEVPIDTDSVSSALDTIPDATRRDELIAKLRGHDLASASEASPSRIATSLKAAGFRTIREAVQFLATHDHEFTRFLTIYNQRARVRRHVFERGESLYLLGHFRVALEQGSVRDFLRAAIPEFHQRPPCSWSADSRAHVAYGTDDARITCGD